MTFSEMMNMTADVLTAVHGNGNDKFSRDFRDTMTALRRLWNGKYDSLELLSAKLSDYWFIGTPDEMAKSGSHAAFSLVREALTKF